MRIHPNIITLGRLDLMIWLTLAFSQGRHVTAAAICLQICYFLDHLDGEMARTHSLVSKFGDYFDHLLDVTYELPLLFILVTRLRTRPHPSLIVGALALMFVASTVVVSCQETVLAGSASPHASDSLKVMHSICPGLVRHHLPLVRWLGQGAFHLAVGAAMMYAGGKG